MQNKSSPNFSSWTPQREARALRLYLLEDLSAEEVADALGGVSRAAVCGKMRRLGYSKRERAAAFDGTATDCKRPPRSRPRIDRHTPPRRPPIPMPPLREVGPTGHPRHLACLSDSACRWPIDDPGPNRMHHALFCAGPVERGPYCPAHTELAAPPPKAAAEAEGGA